VIRTPFLLIGALALLVGCAPKRRAVTAQTPPNCQLGLEVVNETDYSLDVFFASVAKGSPSFRVGRAPKGRTVFRLSDAIISRMNAGPFRSEFSVRRSEAFRTRAEGGTPVLDYSKVRFQTLCM
jgi:hypothetical protein